MAITKQFPLNRKIKNACIVPEGAWLSTLITGSEVFSAVDFFWQPEYEPEYASFDISYFNLPEQAGKNFCGVGIETRDLDNEQYDIITIPAIWRPDPEKIQQEEFFLQWLRDQHSGGAIILGLITGQFYMAAAGLLDGKEATIHGAFASTFQHQYPNVRTNLKKGVTEAGNLICSTGNQSSTDVLMMMISHFCGDETAQLCAKYYEFHEPTVYEPDLFESRTADVLVDAAKERLRHNFRENISLNSLAESLNVSSRTLSRRFQTTTGITPMQYLQKQRLQIGKQLLSSTSLSIDHISEQAGFHSATVFGRAFKKSYGKSPLQYRKFVLSES